jgi:tetratricopeptide (TPR) repeat protein/4-amino-4-deoxy-L-arabinose transferase-like glycosyltransferase
MRRKILLSLIITIGAYLRLSNLGWGLPEVFEEATPWRQAWGMWGFETGRFDFNPHFFNYPAFTFYVQWIGQALIYLIGKVSGTFAFRQDMLAAFEADPYRFYFVGRLITSLFGIASIYLLYKLGKKLFSPAIGLLAAFFLALNFFHIRRGQLITTDVPLVFFILLAFIPIWKIATEGSRRHYIWAGVCVGLATGVKYPGLISAAGIITAHLYHHLAKRQSWKTIVFSPRIWVSAGMVVLAFFMVSPYCLLDYSGFQRDFRFEQAHMKIGHFGSPERFVAYGRYLLSIIPGVMTLPLVVLTLGGLGYGAWKCRNRSIILLTFPLVYFAVVGSWRTAAEHYIFPVIPFLLLFAALLLWRIFETFRLAGSRLLLGVAACLLVLPSAVRIQRFYAGLDVVDNRTVAGQWVEENIERGSAIVKEEYTPDFSAGDYVVFELPLSALYPKSTEPFYNLQWYSDFDYVIISSEVYQRYKNEPGNYQVHTLFYRDLDEYGELVKEFDDLSGSGPQIRIYKVGKRTGRTPEQDFPRELLAPLIDSPDREANAKLLCNLAIVLSQKDKPVKALRLYQLAIAVDSTLTKAWYNMGLTLGNQGKLRESEKALRQAVRLDSTYASSWIGLGHLYRQTGDLDSSIDAYERGLRHDPYRLDVIRILSEQYIRKGRADDAVAISQRGLELSKGSPEFYFILGSGYLLKKEYDNAIRALRKAVELRPSNAEYVYYLAGAYYSKKDYAAALEFARRAEDLGYDAGELLRVLQEVSPPGLQ